MVDYQSEKAEPSVNLPTPPRVLTVGAHPDDAEFGAGGTLAKWARAGAHITILVVTDGSKGTWDPSIASEALIDIRIAEQREAANRLGARDVVNLGHVDGELLYSMPLREEICYHIRRTRPDVVLSHDPWRSYMLHPDHRATGWAAVDGVVAARDHLFHPEQLTGDLTHHRPSSLLLWAAGQPDHWEDIEGHVDAKVGALLAHSTQAPTTMDDAGSTADRTAEFGTKIDRRAAEAGQAAGLSRAEAFKRIEP